MAIKLSDFKKAIYNASGKIIEVPNLYQSIKEDKSKGFKFLARFAHNGEVKSKILGYSKKDNLTPRSANKLLEAYKTDIENGYTSSDKINLDKLFDTYFETLDNTIAGTKKKNAIYNRYVKETLGKKQISSIVENDVNKILVGLKRRGLKPKTVKGVLEVLQPLFKFAIRNKYLKDNVVQYLRVKVPSQKKVVTGATELFNQVHKAIITAYKDEPFYQAFFLFSFTGRRVGEIINLKWENVDFTKNYYWIEDTKNDDKQKYPLPIYIKEQLLQIKDTHRGLVFKSPTTGNKIVNYDRQMRQLKKQMALLFCDDNPLYQAYTVIRTRDKTDTYINALKWSDVVSEDIREILSRYDGVKTGLLFENLIKEKFDNLSPHYMRNILVSMLAEQQVEAIVLSGILGHKDINTINKYLSNNHYKSGQIGLKKIDEVIDIDVLI